MRAGPVERLVATICREACARVLERVKLANLNLDLPRRDERQVEIVASGLPCSRGQQVAIDVTIWSVLTASGAPKGKAAWRDGAVADEARRDKKRAYPELA